MTNPATTDATAQQTQKRVITGPGERVFEAGRTVSAEVRGPAAVEALQEARKIEQLDLRGKEAEASKEKSRFNEQAFLMLNFSDLVEFSKFKADRFKEFAQIDVNSNQETAEFNNILFKNQPKYDLLLNATSLQMSSFTPKIRLFKEYDYNGNTYSFEFPISNGYSQNDFESIFTNKAGRGGGVGLKSFNWTSIGNSTGNQYTFESTVELLFESIEEITKIRNTNDKVPLKDKSGKPVPINLSFADLLVQQLKYDSSREYNPNYYRIKALVGWQVPDTWADDRQRPAYISKEFYQEIKNLTIELYMSLHSHEIDIADDSTVTLKIKYISYIESYAHYPKKSNVFYSDAQESFVKILENKNEQLEKLKGDYVTTPSQTIQDNIDKLQKEIDELQYQDREKIYTRILGYIYSNNALRYYVTSQQTFENFISLAGQGSIADRKSVDFYNKRIGEIIQQNLLLNQSQPQQQNTAATVPTENAAIDLETLKKNIESYTLEQYENVLQNSLNRTDVNVKIIPYFFLGDLLDSVLSGLYGPSGFRNKEMKVVLGPLTVYDYGRLEDLGERQKSDFLISESEDGKKQIQVYTGKPTNINIADIPISLSAYNNWFLTEVVDKNISVMSFKEFLNSVLNNLIIRSMGVETYAFAPRQKTRLVFKTRTLPERPGRFTEKESFRYVANDFITKPFVSNGENPKGPKKIENFIFVYSISNNPWSLESDYKKDFLKGIRHIRYGSDRGLVKTIKFKRQDNKHIRTHNIRIASSINSNKSILLREIYNADVNMLGNNFFEIGEIIYVAPALFGSSSTGPSREKFAKSLGIGGYFMILKINNTISPGNYQTDLTLQWVAKGDGVPNNILDGTVIKKDILIL